MDSSIVQIISVVSSCVIGVCGFAFPFASEYLKSRKEERMKRFESIQRILTETYQDFATSYARLSAVGSVENLSLFLSSANKVLLSSDDDLFRDIQTLSAAVSLNKGIATPETDALFETCLKRLRDQSRIIS